MFSFLKPFLNHVFRRAFLLHFNCFNQTFDLGRRHGACRFSWRRILSVPFTCFGLFLSDKGKPSCSYISSHRTFKRRKFYAAPSFWAGISEWNLCQSFLLSNWNLLNSSRCFLPTRLLLYIIWLLSSLSGYLMQVENEHFSFFLCKSAHAKCCTTFDFVLSTEIFFALYICF